MTAHVSNLPIMDVDIDADSGGGKGGGEVLMLVNHTWAQDGWIEDILQRQKQG